MLPLLDIVPTPKKDCRPSKIALSLLSKASRNPGLISQPISLLALLIIPRWKQPSGSISPVTHSGDRRRGEGLLLFILLPLNVANDFMNHNSIVTVLWSFTTPFHGEIARGNQT